LLTILHEDGRLIAVAKPPGQLVVPGRGKPSGPTLREEAEDYLKKPVFVVHRIDGEASGVVLLAKDALTHRTLSLDFENRRVEKVYRVLAEGKIDQDGRVDGPIREFGSGRMGIAPGGKPSLTNFSVLEKLRGATLLDVRPLTGRKHQIRVHLYSINHPVMGEQL
jgi:tRNA pseudouridine32 synthase/23S rRNA pseudouridine746 synthase/23S rRNA pseudouridine955/2504/2580 synthase